MENTAPLTLPGKQKPYLMAHRGNRAACPENTLAAFRRAFEDGADLLETDLHLTADGELVCIHDAAVDRTTNGTGAVAEMTLAQLKALSASCGMPGFQEERIPTLAETAAVLPPDAALALELKTDRFLEEAVCLQLAEELQRAGIRERSVVISFSEARIQAVKKYAPDIPIGLITLTRIFPKRGMELLGPFWPILYLNPFYVRAAHARGQIVCPLDPASTAHYGWFRFLKVDAVLADDPAAAARALGRR